jgi:hypothetical protein
VQAPDHSASERYPPRAASLILSRAARAHAVSGEGAQAIDRWRGSVTQACRARLYGDVRDLFRAIQYVAMETDPSHVPNLSVVAEGLPNQERLLAGSGEQALAAFEASHNGDVRDAFEDSRRCLREARLAGHLCEEMIYLRLFGDVLGNADEPKEAVEVLAAAGAEEGGRARGAPQRARGHGIPPVPTVRPPGRGGRAGHRRAGPADPGPPGHRDRDSAARRRRENVGDSGLGR